MPSFAEYLINNHLDNDIIWAALFGSLSDLPNRYQKVFADTISIDCFSEKLEDKVHIKKLYQRSIIRAFTIKILQQVLALEDKTEKQIEEIIAQLIALRDERLKPSAEKKVPSSHENHWKNYLLPDLNDEKFTADFDNLAAGLQALGNSIHSLNLSAPTGLNIEKLTPAKISSQLLMYYMFRESRFNLATYPERLHNIASSENKFLIEPLKNIDKTVAIHPESDKYNWQLYGFTNIHSVADEIIKLYPRHPEAKAMKEAIIQGLFRAGILFVRDTKIDSLLRLGKPSEVQWQLQGYSNIHEITEQFFAEKFASQPKTWSDSLKPIMIRGLFEAGIIFIAADKLPIFLEYLFDKLKLNTAADAPPLTNAKVCKVAQGFYESKNLKRISSNKNLLHSSIASPRSTTPQRDSGTPTNTTDVLNALSTGPTKNKKDECERDTFTYSGNNSSSNLSKEISKSSSGNMTQISVITSSSNNVGNVLHTQGEPLNTSNNSSDVQTAPVPNESAGTTVLPLPEHRARIAALLLKGLPGMSPTTPTAPSSPKGGPSASAKPAGESTSRPNSARGSVGGAVAQVRSDGAVLRSRGASSPGFHRLNTNTSTTTSTDTSHSPSSSSDSAHGRKLSPSGTHN